MSSPYLSQPKRDEATVRELMRAKIKAEEAYKTLMYAGTGGKTEDEIIDQRLEGEKAREAMFKASIALSEALK